MDQNKTLIEARGRNGWFKAASADVFKLSACGAEPEKVTVSIYSRQKGEFPPIYLAGPREVMADLFSQILEGIKNIGKAQGPIEITIKERGL